jgi:NADPH:quinone reductase-like Zn-dependent oxidoreductase
MRAVSIESFESPPGLRNDLPKPDAGPTQLLVRVRASSVNPADAAIAAGLLEGMAEYEFPVTLGRSRSLRSPPMRVAVKP